MSVYFANNRASATWKQSYQSHLGTFVSISLGNSCAGLTWEQLYQRHLGTIMPVSLENNCAINIINDDSNININLMILM